MKIAMQGAIVAAALFAASAGATTIASYTLNNAPASGFGGWSYDADTLNDGIIPTNEQDNLLLDLGLAPSIDFVLSASTNISTIDILNDARGNAIPGNLASALVTIGSTSATVSAVGFGPACAAYLCNVRLTLPGSLSSIATTTFSLSGFTAQPGTFSGYTALGEVTVDGGTTVIPEPGSWAMMIAGFGLIGGMVRRRREVVASA